MAKPLFGIPKVRAKFTTIPLASDIAPAGTGIKSTSNSSPIPKTNFGIPSTTPGTASAFSTTGGGTIPVLGGGGFSGTSGGGTASVGGSLTGGSGVAAGTAQLDRSSPTNRNIIDRGLAAIRPSPAVAQAQKTIQAKTVVGIDVLISSEAYNDKNGLSTIRPEFICLSKFLQTTNIDGITPVSQLINLQYNLCQLRQENLFRIMSSISKDSNSNSLLNDLRIAFNSELTNLTNQINGFKKINSDLNQLRNSLELKNISNLNFNTEIFLTLKDFYTSRMGYTETQFNSFANTKIYLQILADFQNILKDYSCNLLNSNSNRIADINSTKILKDTKSNVDFSFTINTLSGINKAYEITKFLPFLSSLSVSKNNNIKILITTLSKILTISKNMNESSIRFLNTSFGFSALANNKSNLAEIITGDIQKDIFTNNQPSIVKNIKQFSLLKDLPDVPNNNYVLTFENQYIDDVENSISFIPGSTYFVDSIIKPIVEIPLSTGFTQRVTSFKTDSYKKFANDFIEQTDKTIQITSQLFDEFSINNSVRINHIILENIKKILNNINSTKDTNLEKNIVLFWGLLFKQANTDKNLKYWLFFLIIRMLLEKTTTENFLILLKNEFSDEADVFNPAFSRGTNEFDNFFADLSNEIGKSLDEAGDAVNYENSYKNPENIKNNIFRKIFTSDNGDSPDNFQGFPRVPREEFENSSNFISINSEDIKNKVELLEGQSSPIVIVQDMILQIMRSYSILGDSSFSTIGKTNYLNYSPSSIIMIIFEIFCSYMNSLFNVKGIVEGGASFDGRDMQFGIDYISSEQIEMMINSIISEGTEGIKAENIRSAGKQTENFNTSTGNVSVPGNVPPTALPTSTQVDITNINVSLIQEEKVIPNILHILWVISQQFKNGINNIDTNFSPQKFNDYSVLFRNFNLDFSDLINPTQIRLNSYLLDTLKEKTPSRISTDSTPDINNILISDIITKQELLMLYSYLQQEKFTSDVSNNKIKIISVGVPDGFSQKIKERITLNTSNTNVDRNAFRNTEIDILTVNIYKRSNLLDDLIFKPQKFLFDLSLFQKEKGILDINPIAGERYSNLISRNILTDYTDPDRLKETTINTITSDSKYLDRLTQPEIRQLFENMNSSYLLGLYINLLTGMNITEEELLTRKTMPLGSLLPPAFISALNSYVNRNLNYPSTLPLDPNLQSKALLDPNIPLNIKDVISLISNGSVVLSIQSISEKIRSAKAFERVFNIAFDDQDFIIDTAKMSSTTSGRAFLISRQFNRIVNPLTNKLNDDYYRNNSFKIDSYHIQLEAQFIRL
jgi:hypothetical protein